MVKEIENTDIDMRDVVSRMDKVSIDMITEGRKTNANIVLIGEYSGHVEFPNMENTSVIGGGWIIDGKESKK